MRMKGIIDPQMGHLEPLLLIQGVEALDTGMEKVEVITIEPQAILPNSINLVVDMNMMAEVEVETETEEISSLKITVTVE